MIAPTRDHRVAVLGASGFVGSALCERLFFEGQQEFVPIIHTSGNAGRVARLPVPVRTASLLDRDGLGAALAGCDVIVNCSLGGRAAMTRGFANLISAARRVGVRRFIHLSSVLVYGEDPAPDTASEAARPAPGRSEYGILKLWQDIHAMRLQRAGVSTYILCPSNIGGPYSPFMRGLVERLQRGPLPLVDGGRYPSNVVHVDNLVEAILAAVGSGDGAGERYFVNEPVPVSWRRVIEDLGRTLGLSCELVDVSRDEVLPFLPSRVRRRAGLREHVRLALSREVRESLVLLPAFAWLHRSAGTLFDRLPPNVQMGVRERLQWPVRIRPAGLRPSMDDRYVTVQVRRVHHSPARLEKRLGWRPPLTYERGLETFSAWARFARLVD